ncbi:CheY-like superfamily [Obelidium mucronatum]|nr:CheY-like superfamily [Obelidium mucronatum]
MLGGELRSYLTSSKGWKIAFELTFQTSSISKNSVAEASAADQIGPYLKTLGMMAKTKRKEKECHASLSMTSVASDIENPPTLFGFLASSLTGYMKTEVFKKSSTRSLMTKQMYLGDEAKSHPSRKSNASALSSGLSSLRRSISSSKNFRKKQVHYLDSTNNMGSSDSKDFEVIDKKLILQGDALMSSSDGDVEQLSLRSSGISLRVPSMKGSSIIAGSNKSSRQGTMRRKTSLHQETNYARADYGSADNAIGEKPENRPMLFEEYRVSQNAGLLHISLPASRRNSSIQSHRASLSSMRRDSVTKEGKSNTISQQDNDAKALESSYPVAIPEVESRNMSIKSESVDDIDLDSEILEAATESVMRVYQHNSCISDHLQGNILLVDDSSVFRQILNKFLTTISSEFSISEAANGEEAFVKCQSTLFNLIFLDMDMPKLNGGQLATKLSSHNYSSPIVIITSNTIPKDEVTRLSTMSVTEVISKPLSKDKVLQLLIKYNKPIALKGIELFSPTVNIPEVQVTDSAASIRTTRSATLPIQISRSPSEARSTAEGTLDGRFNSLKSESSSSRSQNEGPIPIETKLHRFQTGSQESEVGRLSVPSMHTDIKATIPPSSSSAALVVDDSIINRSILVKMLEKLELFDEIVQVANGHDAIRFCTMKPFKIIFMDLEMPGMHGEEAAARIRATGSKTPIIAVTGNIVRGKDENNLKVVGISQILLKPVDRATVKEICSKYGLQGGHRDLTPVSPTNLSAPKPGFGSLRRNLQ